LCINQDQFVGIIRELWQNEDVRNHLMQRRNQSHALKWIDEKNNQYNPEFPWNIFVMSFATMGNAAHWENNVEPNYFGNWRWEVVVNRGVEYVQCMKNNINGGRFRAQNGECFAQAAQYFLDNGILCVRNQWEQSANGQALIKYLKSFNGIGDKYARNMPMDCDDPRVQSHFAIDARINGILNRVLEAQNLQAYEQKEQWLNNIKDDLNRLAKIQIDSWYLDRLLFRYNDSIRQKINANGVQ